MSERSSDLEAHIVATRQLESVITAMRGVAAIRAREAQSRLVGVRAYAEVLGEAIGAALAVSAETPRPARATGRRAAHGHVLLAFCSARGFVGALNEHILEAVSRRAMSTGASRPTLFIIGERGATLAEERGMRADRTLPMAARVDDAPALADRIAETLYQRIGEGRADRVTLIHATPAGGGIGVVERSLVPLDLARFPPAPGAILPLVTLPPETLVESLAQEYVFAELCEAVVLAFAAENDARMRAMIEARDNAQKTLEALEARHRQKRQEEITEEIVELARPASRRPADIRSAS
jgi:F-type H+-transporting ATPase subunit gamma